jgi:ABC-type Zn uptake system ZnuABC Zn-binding protein ZnuA
VTTRTSLARRLTLGVLLVLLAAVLLLPGCSKAGDPWEKVSGGKPRVLVSFAPLYCFAKAVAGPDVAVLSLLAATGPHDYKETADDLIAAQKADLILFNGLTLDDFMTRVASSTKKTEIVHKLADAIPKSQLIHSDEDEPGHAHKHGDGHAHSHGEYDPHVWLGLDNVKPMVQRIAELLSKTDPARKDGYQARADAYVKKLDELKAYGDKLFKDKKNRKFITNHESFRYFARSFGLELLESIQLQAGVEPDGGQIAKLAELCKKHNVRVIGVEPQYSRAAAETLQKSLRKDIPELAIVELDPIETAPPDRLGPDYYLERMKQNLDNLAKHLR